MRRTHQSLFLICTLLNMFSLLPKQNRTLTLGATNFTAAYFSDGSEVILQCGHMLGPYTEGQEDSCMGLIILLIKSHMKLMMRKYSVDSTDCYGCTVYDC